MKKIVSTLVLSFVVLSSTSFGSGFQINEHGARAMAMAGAFTGVLSDASAIYYNPAGLTNLTGTNILAGVTLIALSSKFTGPTPLTTEWEMESQLFTPFNFYVTHSFDNDLSIGLGANNQYGLGTKWASDWAGRYLAVDTEIRSFYFTPAIAYKISDAVSIGIGGVFAFADVKIIRNIPLQDPVTGAMKPDAELTMEGDATSFGFSAGIFVKPSDMVSFGLSYRSQNKYDFEGDAKTVPATLDFNHPLAGPQSIPLPNGGIKAPLTTPQNVTFGIGLYPSKDLTLSADFQWIDWTSYDKLEVTFDDYDLDPQTPGQQNVQSADRNYETSFIIRVGAEYMVSDQFALRGGFFYDKNPVLDEYVEPTLPDADRIGLNIGFGYKISNNVSIDFAYLLLLFSEREITNSKFGFNGVYNSTAHLFGINFAYAIN
ncbi:MAG TPA: hypothetical protein ENN33_03745 [Ignavibacteria bacterium]|nr:hypothetical protein [Ignavibacteria bacterium]